MRRPGGYAITVEPGKADVEQDTITCFHCGRLVFVDPHMDPSKQEFDRVVEPDRCRMCMRHVCPVCMGDMVRGGGCKPFEAKLDAMERRERLLRV